jgi:hypothetical protein
MHQLKTTKTFSTPQLTIFIIAFSLIGYLIFRSFALNPNLPGDLNNDNTVNITDMSILLSNYGTSNSTADINSDGTVNILDLSILLSNYGKSVTAFTTNITQNQTITTPFTWTFNPGVTTTAGYFFADGTQLAKITGPGPYSFSMTTSTLTAGTHTLGGSWDLSDGTHATFPQTYTVTINNGTSGGGGGGSTSSYDSAISYSAPANRPVHSCTRTINVTTASQLTSALNNLQAGDCVVNTQTGGFSISGEVTIAKSLSSYAYIDLKTGTDAVRFTGGGTQTPSTDLPSVYIHNATNIKIYGGNITNNRILVYNPSSNITWWNFYAHDLAGDGLDIFPPFSGTGISNIDFQGEISNWGINCQVLDPHAEKCTGIHGMNLADAGGSTVTNSRFAIYAHDGRSGAAIEQGSPSQPESGITIYLKANNLTMAAQSQVAGNGIQIWGGAPITNSTIQYIEVSNAQGRAIDTNGLYSGVSLSGLTVKYGRATNVLLNPKLSRVIWDTRGGIVYQDISPKP